MGGLDSGKKDLSERNMSEIRSVLQTPLLSEFIGKRVLITGDHPWSDSLGELLSIEHTLAAWGIRIALDGGDQCFMFNSKHNKRVMATSQK